MVSACAPISLQSQALGIKNIFSSFFIGTFFYIYKRSNIINTKRAELLQLEGMEILKKIKEKLLNVKDESLNGLISKINEKINPLYLSCETNNEDVVQTVLGYIRESKYAIKNDILEYKKALSLANLSGSGFNVNMIVSAILSGKETESYKDLIDYISNSKKIEDGKSLSALNSIKGDYSPLPVLREEKKRLEKEIQEEKIFLDSENQGLDFKIKESNRKVIKGYIKDFAANIYDKAKE